MNPKFITIFNNYRLSSLGFKFITNTKMFPSYLPHPQNGAWLPPIDPNDEVRPLNI